MSRYKETRGDQIVKGALWVTTRREVTRWATKCAEAKEKGKAYSEGQKDATAAAKQLGYPKGLVRTLARHIKGGDDEARDEALKSYGVAIGLVV